MRDSLISSGINIFFLVIISMFMVVSAAQADVLVGTAGPPGGGQVRHFNNNGIYLGDFTSGGPELDEPSAVQFGPDGNLYLLTGSDTVIRYNGTTGAFIDVFIPTNSNGLDEAKDMIFGPDGNLYIASNCTNGGDGPDCPPGVIGEGGRVMRFNGTTGAYIDDFVPNGAGQFPNTNTNTVCEAMSMAFGPDGNFYLGNDPRNCGCTEESCYNVMRFDGTTGQYIDTPFPAGFMGLYDPNGLVIGPDCNLYISSEGVSFTFNGASFDNPNVIFRLNLEDDSIDEFVASNNGISPGLDEPEKIAFGPNGNLYVTSGDTSEVYIYRGNTGELIISFPSVSSDPKGITFFPGESPVCKQLGIPTVSEWGLVITAGLFAFIGIFMLRKRAVFLSGK